MRTLALALVAVFVVSQLVAIAVVLSMPFVAWWHRWRGIPPAAPDDDLRTPEAGAWG